MRKNLFFVFFFFALCALAAFAAEPAKTDDISKIVGQPVEKAIADRISAIVSKVQPAGKIEEFNFVDSSANAFFSKWLDGCIVRSVSLGVSDNEYTDPVGTKVSSPGSIYIGDWDACTQIQVGWSSGFFDLYDADFVVEELDSAQLNMNVMATMMDQDGNQTLITVIGSMTFTGSGQAERFADFYRYWGQYCDVSTRSSGKWRQAAVFGSLSVGGDSYVTPPGGNPGNLSASRWHSVVTYH